MRVAWTVTSWVLLVVFGFLSFFGMGLHCVAPRSCGECACHSFESHHAGCVHDETGLHAEAIPAGLHAHGAEFCPICHFCQMTQALVVWQTPLSEKTLTESLTSRAPNALSGTILKGAPCRAPPALS